MRKSKSPYLLELENEARNWDRRASTTTGEEHREAVERSNKAWSVFREERGRVANERS